ncbi:MAG: 50S ribosomal protein L5 [Candidatus Spechtbacterales bacterium]
MATTLDLEKQYKDDIVPGLAETLGDVNVHELPRLTKAVVNTGVGRVAYQRRLRSASKQTEEELVADILQALSMVAGQRPKVVIANRSIAGFKLRAGTVVGMAVTLRGRRMYDFLGRLVHVALPRTRDFRGVSKKGVDKNGNLTIGIRDASIFPELSQQTNLQQFGFEVTLVTNTTDRAAALELFERLGIPFAKEEK